MKALTYQSMTSEHWQQLTRQLEEVFTLNIKTDKGRCEHMGFEMQWCYEVDAQTLTLECTNKPVWIPEALLEAKINIVVNNIIATGLSQGGSPDNASRREGEQA